MTACQSNAQNCFTSNTDFKLKELLITDKKAINSNG